VQASDLKAWRFRFTEPVDQEKYGDGWFLWDEAAAIRLPARQLIELEGEIGIRMARVIDLARVSATVGDLAAAWLAVRAADPELAGTYADFNPLIAFTDWELAPVEEPETAAPLDPTPAPDSAPPPAAE